MSATTSTTKLPSRLHDANLRVTLHSPSGSYRSFRVVFYDPCVLDKNGKAKRSSRSAATAEAAEDLYYEVCTYVREGRRAVEGGSVPLVDSGPASQRQQPRTLDALFDLLVGRMTKLGRAQSYISMRKEAYDYWICPRIGHVEVCDWTPKVSEVVICAMRDSPSTGPDRIQSVGSILRSMVGHAEYEGWELPRDPMRDVAYTKPATVQAEYAEYVPPSRRPSTSMVEQLMSGAHILHADTSTWWIELMHGTAAYTGARFGELTALMPEHYCPTENSLSVEQAWCWPRKAEREAGRRDPYLKDTKNHLRRKVLLPQSLAPAMRRRVAEVEALGIPGALLFPSFSGPQRPWAESGFRIQVFVPCAKAGGWTILGEKRTPTGKGKGKGRLYPGRTELPYRNLRHHAATWLHEVAGYEWEDVSYALGHATPEFTRRIYVRRRADADARNLASMARL